MSSEKVPVNTTLDYALKTEMQNAGLSFSTALTIGCNELLEKKAFGKDSRERAASLSCMMRQVALALPEGLTIGGLIDKGREIAAKMPAEAAP